VLFAVGLLGASLLAAAILPVTAAYVIAETFGLEKGLARRPREAPVFVAVLTTLIVIGMAVAVIPNMPVIKLLVLVQVVNGMLLPVTLFFVWRLSSSRELMGDYRNGRIFNLVAGATVVITSTLSVLLLVVTLSGNA
jgi:Mn2+/Fe2+ NRAMP family transporter